MNELLWVDPLSRVEIEERAEGFLRAHAPSVLMSLQPTPIFAIFDAWIPGTDGLDCEVVPDDGRLDAWFNPLDSSLSVTNSVYLSLETDASGAALTATMARARFTAAHEFGHATLHAKQGVAAATDATVAARRVDPDAPKRPIYESAEWQADAFAAAVLMPRRSLDTLHRHEHLTPALIADVFRVNGSPARIRYGHWRNRQLYPKN